MSGLDLLHADDLPAVASILAFEQEIDVSIRSSVAARSVRMIRVRCGDGAWRTFEAALSNQYDDPEVGHLLIDLQAPSQLSHAHRAIELTRLGADLRDVLDVILAELTTADPGGVAAAMFDHNDSVLVATANAPTPWGSAAFDRYHYTWTVPLIDASMDRPSGTLRVWCTLEEPHPLDVETSERIAGHAALVIGRERALQELRLAAFRDPLTGLANRRALEMEIVDRRKAGRVVLVAYIDLNGFKAVNDRIGHDAGDEVLKIVAERLKRSLRAGDVVVRMGGDEFVLLVSSPAPPSDAFMKRLDTVIRAPMMIGDEVVSVSAAIGLAEGPGDTSELLSLADQAMLAWKRTSSPTA